MDKGRSAPSARIFRSSSSIRSHWPLEVRNRTFPPLTARSMRVGNLQAARGIGRGHRRGGGRGDRCRRAHRPIAGAFGVALEDDHRLDQLQLLEPQRPAPEGPEVDRRRTAVDANHLGRAAPGRAGEADIPEFDRERIAPADLEAADRQPPVEGFALIAFDPGAKIGRRQEQDGATEDQDESAEQPEDPDGAAPAQGWTMARPAALERRSRAGAREDDRTWRSSAQVHRRNLYCPNRGPRHRLRGIGRPGPTPVRSVGSGNRGSPGCAGSVSAGFGYLEPAKAGIDPGRVGPFSPALINLPSSRRARETRLLTVPIGAPQTAAAAS